MRYGIIVCLLALALPAVAAQSAVVRVVVHSDGSAIEGAEVSIGAQTAKTSTEGLVVLTVAPGDITVVVSKEKYAPASASLTLRQGQEQEVAVDLIPQPSVEETVVVAATRTEGRLEDQPLRVEVLEREEIEEKMLMTPGDIVMMLNEMGGMRVQATSPSLGAASVRIQGMRGRYTRFFSDGLPLFGEVGGLGLLQVPPMDLRQVEVIKGVASSLYGAGAMGGVVNLISRRPGDRAEREFLVNQSTRGASDAVGFFSAPLSGHWGATLLASGHRQERVDVDDDQWADLPQYLRGVVRPRVFWNDGAGRSFFATVGVTAENRSGGTLPNVALPAAGAPYVEALETRRWDTGGVGQFIIGGRYVVSARAAFAQQHHRHQFGEVVERDQHRTAFVEGTIRGNAGRHTWVGGVAVEHDGYVARDLPVFSYAFTVPGIFAQDDIAFTHWLSVSASARADHHSRYGTFISPKVAVLLRSGQWNSRVSVGTGFFGPSPLTEETEAAGLSRLVIPAALVAERGSSSSIDLTRQMGRITATVTAFGSRVAHPVQVERRDAFVLTNGSEPTRNVGAEVLLTARINPVTITGTYAYVRSHEVVDGVEREIPLTPRQSAGLVGMWERENVGRVGIETYYTGVQRLEANPYAQQSRAYVVVGLLAERQLGRLRLFINGEDLTGVKQSASYPLIRPDRSADGRWTVDAWAPLEGRNINGGIRVRF